MGVEERQQRGQRAGGGEEGVVGGVDARGRAGGGGGEGAGVVGVGCLLEGGECVSV